MEKPFWMPDLPTFIALFLLTIFGMAVVMLMFTPMPMTEAAGTLLTAMIGMLITKIGTMVDFYFGSSKGSKDKDQALVDAATHSNAAQPPVQAAP